MKKNIFLKLFLCISSIGFSNQLLNACTSPTIQAPISITYSNVQPPRATAYSPDGSEVAIVQNTGTTSNIFFYDTSSNTLLRTWVLPTVSDIAYAPDGLTLAVGNTQSQQLQIYDITDDSAPLVSLSNPLSQFPAAITYAPNGQYIAFTTQSGNTPTGLGVVKVENPIGLSNVVYFAPNSSASGAVNQPTSLSFNPSGTVLVYTNLSQINSQYYYADLVMGGSFDSHLYLSPGSGLPVGGIQYSPDGQFVSLVTNSRYFRCPGANLGAPVDIAPTNMSPQIFVYSPDSKYIAYCDSSNAYFIAASDSLAIQSSFSTTDTINDFANAHTLAFSPNGNQLSAITFSNKSLRFPLGNIASFTVSPLFSANCNANTAIPLTVSGTLNSINWTLPDGTSSTDNPLQATLSGLYTVNVTDASSNCNGLSKLVYVNSQPNITQQPVSQSVTEGSSVTFEVIATPASVTYQWQVSTDSGVTFTDIPGATASTYMLTATAAETGNQYRAALSNPQFPECDIVSNSATLTISGTITPAGPITICFGGSVILTAQTSAVSPTYQWFNSADNITFNPIAGETLQTYEATTSGFYRVTINGIPTPSVQLTVSLQVPATITPSGTVQINQGTSQLLSATTGTGFTYQWFKDGVFINNTQDITVTDSGSYTVTVTDTSSCSSTSAPTIIDVIPVGNIVVEITPSIQEVELGGTATFTATVVTGTATSLTWTGPNNFTATGNTITLTNVTRQMIGQYYVTAKNGNTTRTFSASLALKSAFNVAITTPSLMNILGSNVTLTAVTSGANGPFVYVWTGPNGFTFSSGEPTLTLEFFSRQDIGSYTVTVYDVNRNSDTAGIDLAGVAVTSNSGSVTQDNNTNIITSSLNYEVEVIGGSGLYAYTWYGANVYPQLSAARQINSGISMNLVSATGPAYNLAPANRNNELLFSVNTVNDQFTSSATSNLQATLYQDPVSLFNSYNSLRAYALMLFVVVRDANGNTSIISLPIGQKLDQGDVAALTSKYSSQSKTSNNPSNTLPSLSNVISGGYAIGSKDQKLLACMQAIACVIVTAIALAVVAVAAVGLLPVALLPFGGGFAATTGTFTATTLIPSIVASAVIGSVTFFSVLGISFTSTSLQPTPTQTTIPNGDQTLNPRRLNV